MVGELDLDTLLAAMQPTLLEENSYSVQCREWATGIWKPCSPWPAIVRLRA